MGRLVGIPHFLSEAAHAEEKADAASLRRARNQLPEDYDPLNDDEDDPIKLCCIEAAQRMHAQFDNRTIRRTINSTNWENKPLINLPKCHTTTVNIQLSEREMSRIKVLADRVKERYVVYQNPLQLLAH